MRIRWLLCAVLIVVLVVVCWRLFVAHHSTQDTVLTVSVAQSAEPSSQNAMEEGAEAAKPYAQSPDAEQRPVNWDAVVVQSGETLSQLFERYQLGYGVLNRLLILPGVKQYLGHLHAGQVLYFHVIDKKQFALRVPIAGGRRLLLTCNQTVCERHFESVPLERTIVYKTAVIQHSLAQTAQRLSLTPTQQGQLTSLFAGSVNLLRAIQKGDVISLLYEDFHEAGGGQGRHGAVVHQPGNILAATLTTRGQAYTALRFMYPGQRAAAYYTPAGRAVEPLFLNKPVNYERISSRFALSRYDPVVHMIRPHFGVDFVAPRGTPVHSIGDGKIVFFGWKGGYGKSVVVSHSRKYKTLYAHLSKFAADLGLGRWVSKGQVVGYVGSTGWATGPHLHFGLYVYGIPRNPLKMHVVFASAVPKKYFYAFHKESAFLLNELYRHQTVVNDKM